MAKQELNSSWDGRPWPRQAWAERWGAAVPLSCRAGTPSKTMWPGPRSTSVPSGVFIHPVVWPQRTLDKNWGGCAPLGEGKLGPHPTQTRLGWGLPPYQVASWWIQPFGDNKNEPKIRGLPPFWGRGTGTPSSTMWLGPRPTSMPCGILIYPAVWPQ